jgi:hypothetical protein
MESQTYPNKIVGSRSKHVHLLARKLHRQMEGLFYINCDLF